MEYEALKDSWSDVEDRDGIRLSWNTFPSSRMVLEPYPSQTLICAKEFEGSLTARGSYRRLIHPSQGEA